MHVSVCLSVCSFCCENQRQSAAQTLDISRANTGYQPRKHWISAAKISCKHSRTATKTATASLVLQKSAADRHAHTHEHTGLDQNPPRKPASKNSRGQTDTRACPFTYRRRLLEKVYTNEVVNLYCFHLNLFVMPSTACNFFKMLRKPF